jgi:hypothetical protein
MYSFTLSLTSALDEGAWSTPHPGRFTRRETRYPLYRRLGRPHGLSGRLRKILLPPGFYPRTLKPVAKRYSVPYVIDAGLRKIIVVEN